MLVFDDGRASYLHEIYGDLQTDVGTTLYFFLQGIGILFSGLFGTATGCTVSMLVAQVLCYLYAM